MPRILYFCRDYTSHDRRFLSAVAASPYEMYFLRLEADGIPYEPRPLPEGVHPVEWEGGRRPLQTPEGWLRLMPAFDAVVERIHPDLIHAGPVPSCGLMAALLGVRPLLLMSWASDILVDADRDAQWRWMTRYALLHSDLLLCDSGAVRQKAKELVAYPDERIVQFPWGIDLHVFTPRTGTSAIRVRLGWERELVVISTRGWDKVYGLDTLLEAFALAADVDPRLRLLLLGTGTAREAVMSRLRRSRLRRLVHDAGHVPPHDVAGYFQAADIYLSCAHYDGTSVSLLEALASGLPVVVTDHPGNREWVQPNLHGWLGTDGDASSFATALLKACQLSPSERDAFRQRNRQLAEGRADWSRNVDKLLAAYAMLAQPVVP